MRRKNLFRTIILILLIAWALYELLPTYRLGGLNDKKDEYLGELSQLSGLDVVDLETALSVGELESYVTQNVSALAQDTVQLARELSASLVDLKIKMDGNVEEALKQGLDLVGGTYLVYEADLPQLARTLANDRDERFSEIIEEIEQEFSAESEDFFVLLHQKFRENDVPLNRYYGRRGQSDDVILNDLREEAKDAIARTLEKLRNRVDQFGVSEPSITPQGEKRIIIQLAGVHDIDRAKNVINSTALLELQMVRDPELTMKVLEDIDRTLKRVRSRNAGEPMAALEELELAAADSAEETLPEQQLAEDEEIDLAELFGQDQAVVTDEETQEQDSTILVDRQTFEEYPFFSLLRVQGSDVVLVPEQNVLAVKRILQMPEIERVIPGDSEFLWSSRPSMIGNQEYSQLYFLKKDPEITGDYIKDASVGISGGESSVRTGQAVVNFELNNEGAKIFRRVTGANVDKFLAIVLDDKVSSNPPRIKERIPNGRSQIDGIATMKEAQDIAVVLRTGALPAPVQTIEERTVGPSLGQDSIEKGTRTAIIGAILVAIFMIFYYRMSGIIADFALGLNLLLLLAALAGLHATLTLPGIAGIVLTIGMAVDANVLIFERIREELRTGKTIKAAIDSGYARAFRTILDANVTTLLTAVVLYQFGTGPLKGFATTLSIGLIINMYTAIVVTRMIFDYITTRYSPAKLSI